MRPLRSRLAVHRFDRRCHHPRSRTSFLEIEDEGHPKEGSKVNLEYTARILTLQQEDHRNRDGSMWIGLGKEEQHVVRT